MKAQSKNYTEYEVVASLQKKNDIKIKGKDVFLLSGASAKGDVGNKSKGKLDYLRKAHSYRIIPVSKFPA